MAYKGVIAGLIALLIDWLRTRFKRQRTELGDKRKQRRKEDYEERQKKRDRIYEDPAGAFNDKFNRSDNRVRDDEDSSKAGKT